MNMLANRDRKFQKKKKRAIRNKKGIPFTRFRNFLWTLGILAVAGFLLYLAMPYIEVWWLTLTDAIE